MNIWDLDDRELKRAAKAILQENKTWPDYLVEINPAKVAPIASKQSKTLLRAFRSNRFLVQEYEEGQFIRLSITRNQVDLVERRFIDGITWDDIQEIKEQCGYSKHCAIEIFPPDELIVNVANVRHIWIYKEGEHPMMWKKPCQ